MTREQAAKELRAPIERPPAGFSLGDCSKPGMFAYMADLTEKIGAECSYRYHLKMAARYRRYARTIDPQPPVSNSEQK